MAIYDTSNVIDASLFLKSKLAKNMVGENYYVDNLQEKINLDWDYRYNIVGIEEELNKQIHYTKEQPKFTPIDVAITNVKSDIVDDKGTDWARIAFRDLKHPSQIGFRYRFSLDFPDMSQMTEDKKVNDTSVWICVNKTPIRAGSACIVRRCNNFLLMVGSDKNKITDVNDVKEFHCEPCILENELKYMQIYYNHFVPIPQSEWYAIMQLNYFTNNIKINDRFMLGPFDINNPENNPIYKVKSVTKSEMNKTFINSQDDELESIPLIIVAMDKDLLAPDDLPYKDEDEVLEYRHRRYVENTPVYFVPQNNTQFDDINKEQYSIIIEGIENDRLFLTEELTYIAKLFKNKQINKKAIFTFSCNIEGLSEDEQRKYFNYSIANNSITIKNLRSYSKPILVKASCEVVNEQGNKKEISTAFEIELGGFY